LILLLAVAVAADLLLRFRLAAALLPGGARRHARMKPLGRWLRWPFVPLAESASTAARNLLVVGVHVWLRHLVIAALGALFVVLPSSLVQWQVVPNPLAGALGQPTGHLLVTTLTSVATTLIGALVTAFCIIYDARLFVALQLAESGK
jgi:hypothetical protein